MKTNRLFIAVAIIIAGSFFVNVSAQDALKAIAKKCETLDNVNISVVRSRNKETKTVEMYVMNVDFKDNEALKKEILAAFEKDRVNADHEVEDRKNGKVRELLLRFGSSTYTFSERNNGNFSFSLIEDYGKKDGAFLQHGYGYYLHGVRPFQAQIDVIESIDWEDITENFKKGFEVFNGDFEIDMKDLEINMKNHEENMKEHEKQKENFEKEMKDFEINMKNHEENMKEHEKQKENFEKEMKNFEKNMENFKREAENIEIEIETEELGSEENNENEEIE